MKESGLLNFYWKNVFIPNKGSALFLLIIMAVGSILEMGAIALVAPLLTVATSSEISANGRLVHLLEHLFVSFGVDYSMQRALLALLLLVCLFAIGHALFLLWQLMKTAQIQERMRRQMKSRIFEKILNAEYDHLNKQNRGNLIYDLNTPPHSLERAVGYFGKMAAALMTVGSIIGLMLYVSWKATLVTGVIGGLLVGVWRKFTDNLARKLGREIYDFESRVSQIEIDAIDGVKVVKSFGLAGLMKEWHGKILKDRVKPVLDIVFYTNAPKTVNTIIASFLVIGLAAAVFGLGLSDMSFPQLVVFFIAMRQLGPALAAINGCFTELSKERKNIEVIERAIHQMPQEKQLAAKKNLGDIQRISFRDLSFFYSGNAERLVVDGLTLEMTRGTLTALVGATGAGKSTVANLLVGLYSPAGGSISINGIDSKEINLQDWRKRVGYVGQDVFLFNATIAENITLWDPSVTAEQLERALTLAQIYEFTQTLPEGLNTRVGDRGFRLSGGQCQRLAVARALLRQPEVLIFDEATSALDTLTEKAIYNAIGLLRANAVVLVIAHRLSTVREADQIVVLENGRAVETGTHHQLLAKKGRYAAFYEEHKMGNEPTMESISA